MSYKIHIAALDVGGVIETACGIAVIERDGLHAWPEGQGTHFWGAAFDEVDCKRCLRARTRERYFTSIRRPDMH